MATQAQLDAIAKYQATGDASGLVSEYPTKDFQSTNGTTYNVEGNNPSELKAAKDEGGVLTPPAPVVTGVTNGTALSGSAGNVLGTVDSVVTYESTVGTGALTYTSSDTNIATVDASGVVTGVNGGVASITATSVEDSNFSGTTTVDVLK